MSDLTNGSLEELIERLIVKRQHLDNVITWLNNLEISCTIPGIKSEEIGLTVDIQTLRIWKKDPQPAVPHAKQDLIGSSAAIRTIADIALRIADGEENIVLQGETGVGKSHLASYIHNSGKRKKEPLVKIPALALGDKRDIARQLNRAGHGTLYLNNLQDLDAKSQNNLWEELSGYGPNRRCRLITSSQVDLELLVTEGDFFLPLKDVLSQCYIPLPQLKERSSDIPEFASYYLPLLCRKNAKSLKAMSPEYLETLKLYDWPGNVRELINILEQSIYMAGDKQTLFNKDLPLKIRIETSRKVAEAKRGI